MSYLFTEIITLKDKDIIILLDIKYNKPIGKFNTYVNDNIKPSYPHIDDIKLKKELDYILYYDEIFIKKLKNIYCNFAEISKLSNDEIIKLLELKKTYIEEFDTYVKDNIKLKEELDYIIQDIEYIHKFKKKELKKNFTEILKYNDEDLVDLIKQYMGTSSKNKSLSNLTEEINDIINAILDDNIDFIDSNYVKDDNGYIKAIKAINHIKERKAGNNTSYKIIKVLKKYK